MAERRKIIIQTGEEPDAPLPTPHFDAEATLTARPVVPLTDQETHRMPYGDYAGRAPKPFWKRPALLVAIVLAAIGVGVAAGLAIGIYRNRNTAETPTATAPTTTVENTDLGQTVEPKPTPEERIATVAEQPEEEPAVEPNEKVEPKEEERERTTARNERRDNDDEERQPVATKPPVVREKKPIKIDEYTIEDGRAEKEAEREQRREERRAERRERRRRRGGEEIIIPRGMERAGREVNRIREIFEGRQP